MAASRFERGHEAYCPRCRARRCMSTAKIVVMRNGRRAARGKCPTCGTGMYRILPAAKAQR